MAGRRAKCNGCGGEFRLPAAADAPPPPPKAPPQPLHVSFNCALCETRMTVAVSQVGRQAKCPDCGHLTVVPPPPPPKAPVIPAAMFGEQYEVWGVDDAPTPAQQAAVAPPLIAVHCRLCDTLMHARHDQIGASLACPDCGARTEVRPPPARPPAGIQPPTDDGGYELDEASAPTPRPVPKIVAVEAARQHEATRTKQADPRLDKRQAAIEDAKPTMPRVPLVQGAASMLLTAVILKWWISLSCAVTATAWFGLQVLTAFSSGGGAIMALCFFVVGVILGGCTYVAASALWGAIVTESSDGHRWLVDPPGPNFTEWFGDAGYMFVAAAAATLPAWAVVRFVPLGPLDPLATGAAVWAAAFPLTLLSALEEGSAMGVLHLGVWSTLFKRPWAWLLLFAEVAALGYGLGWALGRIPQPVVLGPWVAVAASFVYFRLIGLQGWWLAESLSTEPEEREYDPTDYRQRAAQ